MPVLNLNTVEDTTLWKRLETSYSDTNLAKELAYSLSSVCKEAYDRMKSFPSLHPEYTLHDEAHLLRVTELMFRIMPSSVVKRLNPVEITLLILSAHFHDQGMVLGKEEIEALPTDTDFIMFKENWGIEHPNVKEIRQRLRDKNLSEEEQRRCRDIEYELQAAMLTDYIRRTHGQRSAKLVKQIYGNDKRWVACGTNLAELVARLCESHVLPASNLIPSKGFHFDESVGLYRVNMCYLGLILRLADILDLDRDRTPDSLYRTINFRSSISIREWEKHRSVSGWDIKPDLIRFTMRCEHPEYQRAAYQFMDWIDNELVDAQNIVRGFPVEFADYKLDLPTRVDRSRIEPADEKYIYYDLEFSLSRDEIVKLLMTNNLYGAPWLCVRELLQNSLDALRHRKAVIKRDNGTDWVLGKVEMLHELDEQGHEVVCCIDNGIGMDRSIIERFLTRVGRSYYRSPEFEQERSSFRIAGVDFDPCAQFGIGFMSCFMLGDHITIYTRRDRGPLQGQGEPLIVEINGLGGIVVVRKGPDNQSIGTTIKITGRKKPRYLDKWKDQVRLIEVINGYALACEFPIEGYCNLPEIASSTSIPADVAIPQTPIESSRISSFITLEQSFSEIDPLLGGVVKTSFLVDESGRLALQNDEAEWRIRAGARDEEPALLYPDGTEIDIHFIRYDNQTCIDGILVGGHPGRGDKELRERSIGAHANPIDLGRMRFVLDIRGQIKPPLTPARTPLDSEYRPFSKGPRWDYIQMLADKAQGRLWEKVAQQLNNSLDAETFWQLAIIYHGYNADIFWMRAKTIWSHLSVPIIYKDGRYEWKALSSLGVLKLESIQKSDKEGESYHLICVDEGRIGAYEKLIAWVPSNAKGSTDWDLTYTVASMSTVTLKDGNPCLEMRAPSQPNLSPWEFVIGDWTERVLALPYSGEISEFISIFMPLRNANRDHPIVRVALEARYKEDPSELQAFAKSVIWCLTSPETIALILNKELPIRGWYKHVGSLYQDVNWQSISSDLHPPYKIRLEDGSSIEVNGEQFEQWANSESISNKW